MSVFYRVKRRIYNIPVSLNVAVTAGLTVLSVKVQVVVFPAAMAKEVIT